MTPAEVPRAFEREMGCTAAELRGWLPEATRGAPIAWQGEGADVQLDGGLLALRWQARAPRRIALISLPRLHVSFAFDAGVSDDERRRFLRYFDLYTQRGGG